MKINTLIAFAVLGCMMSSSCAAQPTMLHPDRVRYDGQCFTIDGRDTFVYSGAFHYFRCPKQLWRARFQSIKDAGFNAVETYVAWNWSEREKPRGLDDFSHVDLKDLDEWLTMAENEFGLYAIVRPGPYICSEWATGGLPNWLESFAPQHPKRKQWFRTDDPVFEQWSKHWFDAVAKVVKKHELFRKPVGAKGVILWQVENEYDYAGLGEDTMRNFTRFLVKTTLEAGIETPIFTCWTWVTRQPKGDALLSQAFDCPNVYPRWDIESTVQRLKEQHTAEPWAPKMITEFQGGWFGQVGGQAAEEQEGIDAKQITAHTLLAIGHGLTALNYYMLFGGTNFGDWAAASVTSSYDYAAPIREWGGEGEKYRAVQAIGRMLERFGVDLARSAEIADDVRSDVGSLDLVERKGKSGATYLFLWNKDRSKAVSGRLTNGVPYDLGPSDANVYRYERQPLEGEWLVNPASAPPEQLPDAIRLTKATLAYGTPTGWKPVKGPHADTRDLGVWDSRFVFLKIAVPKSAKRFLWVECLDETEFYCPTGSDVIAARNGVSWIPAQGDAVGVMLNRGWPNGGGDMENHHGIAGVSICGRAPTEVILDNWRLKTATDDEARSLVGVGVEDSKWPLADFHHIPEHTTVVGRTTLDLGSLSDGPMLLNTEGIDDLGWFYVNGHKVNDKVVGMGPEQFDVKQYLHPGRNVIAVIAHNNGGPGELMGRLTLNTPPGDAEPTTMSWTDAATFGPASDYELDQKPALQRYEHPQIDGPRRMEGHMLVKSSIAFAKPPSGHSWEIILQAGGDGFVSLNGHVLGRYWELGPQRGFFMPECWLQDQNVVELVAIPGRLGDHIAAAGLSPLPNH